MARLDLDPRYEEVTGTEVIKFITKLMHDAWQATAIINIQIIGATQLHLSMSTIIDNRCYLWSNHTVKVGADQGN